LCTFWGERWVYVFFCPHFFSRFLPFSKQKSEDAHFFEKQEMMAVVTPGPFSPGEFWLKIYSQFLFSLL